MEAETQRFVRTVRWTAIVCAIGGVLLALLLEYWVGDREGVFDVLIFSPLLALTGGLLGVFIGGWIPAFRQAGPRPGGEDGEF